MKLILLAMALLSGPCLFAHEIFVVLDRGSVAMVDAVKKPAVHSDPAKAAFLAACHADLSRPAVFAKLPLVSPPEWGKTVAGAVGKIEFHDSFRGGFFVRVLLEGLSPKHGYILTLNGKPGLAGNEKLVDLVPGMEKEQERYFDFMHVKTDEHGRYEATFGIALPAGPYDVRFYVKDTADFKIVLYHDYFKFKVD